ncbi:unnamed protein product [Rotaria sp. Silwood1]|nr:unnamed protein product [Rotaria sp. Silwood1]CAF1562132.1 unnamed protein product [Rotaria sp. Silwood1]
MYNIECQIQLTEKQEISLTLTGIKKNVKTVREIITNLFESTQIKIYDKENIDQPMIYWSKTIRSDLIILVIQQIMDHHNIFTLWEKTAMFSGYFKVVYLTHESFLVSETKITEILRNEIAYVEDMVMPCEKTKNFLNDIDQFILARQDPELAIIRCKYPYKLDIKISLFGRKSVVKKAKKQLQSIINKHTIKIFPLRITTNQQDYLLENCTEQLKDLEHEYKDDCLRIRIRDKEFSAPQYLIDRIQEKIKRLFIQTSTFQYQKLGDSLQITDENYKKLNQIAQYNYCQIEKIETKAEMKAYSVPKALSPTLNISSSIIEQSNEFISSLSMRKIAILNGSIEIYLANETSSILRDVTVISSRAAAVQEGIEYLSDYGYSETKTGRKFLFYSWSPILSNDDKTNKKLIKSIEKFISSTLQNIITSFANIETVAFLTNEWENVGIQQQRPLANNLINQVKQEIETRKLNWRILFIFNNQQANFYKEFCQILIESQSEQDGFAQFSAPISIIQITVATASNFDRVKCENEINNYVQNYITANKTLSNELDVRQWDQNMINAFYKYCLDKSILPKIDLLVHTHIHLTGAMLCLKKTIEKYKLMSEIFKHKSSLRIPPPVIPRTSKPTNDRSKQMNLNAYNIYFSCCEQDQTFCNRITSYLIGEGYSVCETSSNSSQFQSFIDKCDVILISFNENYFKNKYSNMELNYAKLKGKQLLPFVIRYSSEENPWLTSLTLAELFYDVFNTEIDIEFKDDFDLEYDKLLSKLLRYTKPGVTGKIYSETAVLPKLTENKEDNEERAFGNKSIALQKVTSEQRHERETSYRKYLTKTIENEKIPTDELRESNEDLTKVINDLERILRGEDPYTELPVESYEWYGRREGNLPLDELTSYYIREFLNSVKRWLNKSTNAIRGNIIPFTPTGDINDAIFVIDQPSYSKLFEKNFLSFDHSPPNQYFSPFKSNPGSCFNHEESQDYYQKLIQCSRPINSIEAIMEDNDTAWDTVSLYHTPIDVDEDDIDIERKTLDEIKKLEKLDNPNRVWKNTRNAEKFIQQKIKNILELKELCEKST